MFIINGIPIWIIIINDFPTPVDNLSAGSKFDYEYVVENDQHKKL